MPTRSSNPQSAIHNPQSFEVFDCHAHGPTIDEKFVQMTPMFKSYAEYLAYLSHSGISLAVQNSWSAVKAKTRKALADGNAAALSWARQGTSRKLRLIPALITHPDFLGQAAKDIERFRQAGTCWVGEVCAYNAGYTSEHPQYMKMLEMIDEAGFVYQLHEEPAANLRKMVLHCPTLPLVVSHLGGSPDGINEKLLLAQEFPSVYLDICGWGHERIGMIEKGVDMGLEDRILYGSDFPINEPGGPLIRILNSSMSKTVKRKILAGNLRKLMASKGVEI
jgi:hypothetical protein